MPFLFSLLLAVAIILLLFLLTRISSGEGNRRGGDRRPRLGPELIGLGLLFFLLLAALWLLRGP